MVDIVEKPGGQGNDDPVLLEDILGEPKPDRFNRASFIREGSISVLVGAGGNLSMRTGEAVNLTDLVKFLSHSLHHSSIAVIACMYKVRRYHASNLNTSSSIFLLSISQFLS